jgi:ribosomal subunit interface protein
MKISYSHIQTEFREAIDHEAERHIQKLGRLLKRYNGDLVQLHLSLEKEPRKAAYNFSLNLALPTGTLHATGQGADVRASAKIAFAEIELQVKKHQEKLRKDYSWKRKRVRSLAVPGTAPSGD